MKKILLLSIVTIWSITFLRAQKTFVPDNNFEQFLIDQSYDDVLDDSVLTANVSSIATLSIGGYAISDLTGIQAFSSLHSLDCSNNYLTEINLSGNPLLTGLNLANNYLTSLDLSSNQQISWLLITNNLITQIDVTDLTQLDFFAGNNNQLTSLDISQNSALRTCAFADNYIDSLNITLNPILTDLYLQSNNLGYANLKNGNNLNLNVDISGNSNLLCVLVDDSLANHSAWNVGNAEYFQTESACQGNIQIFVLKAFVPDNNFEQALIELGYDDVLDDSVLVENIESVPYLDLTSKDINNLTGIEFFTNLYTLEASYNNLSTVDLSNNLFLINLNLANNQLTDVNLENLNNIDWVSVSGNQLQTLDVSDINSAQTLFVGFNQLSQINLSNMTQLHHFVGLSNLFDSLDFSNNTQITEINISGNVLNYLNLRNGNNSNMLVYFDNNPDLYCAVVDQATASHSSWTFDTQLSFVEDMDDCTQGIGSVSKNEWTVYPNPASQKFQIIGTESALLTLYNSTGKIVMKEQIEGNKYIDISHLSKGIYQIRIESARQIQHQKLVVQ